MEHPPIDRVTLDGVDQDRRRLLAIDRQVDERVLADPPLELLELVDVEAERLGRDAMAVDDRGELAGPTQTCDALAEDFAVGRGQGRPIGGHGVGDPPSMCSRTVAQAGHRPQSRPLLGPGPARAHGSG